MKILVTGSTATQVGRPNRAGFVSAPVLLVEALRGQGHRVDWRPVTPGEDLKGYRRVISFLAPPLTFGSTEYFGALWGLTHPKAVAAVDDWRLRLIIRHARSSHNDPERLWTSLAGQNRSKASTAASLKRKRVMRELNHLVSLGETGFQAEAKTGWPWPIAAPLFEWGDPAKFPIRTRERVYAYDPTPLMPRPKEHDRVSKRRKAWLLASLSNHEPWLDRLKPTLRWRVDYYGGTAKLRKSGYALEPLQEAQLVREVYPLYPATLCPPYDHAGSGWWRARLAHAAWAGCLTVGFQGELDAAGRPFILEPKAVENLSLGQLEALANTQAEVIRARCTSQALQAAVSDLINLN